MEPFVMTHSILNHIGNTPLVEIRRLNPNPQVRVLAKLEYLNWPPRLPTITIMGPIAIAAMPMGQVCSRCRRRGMRWIVAAGAASQGCGPLPHPGCAAVSTL